jgi:predicted nucleotidyltransferase
VREIVLDVFGQEDARVYLFGSCATGLLRPSSDIDVAIDPRRRLASASFATLRERLEESDVPYDVDVVDLSTAPSEFANRVRREGIVWKG